MTRDFALGILAGLIIGLLWIRYTPPPSGNRKRQPMATKRVIDIFENREGLG